jgi:hypothetical protein
MSGFLDKLRQWGRPWAAGTEPIEIHRAILEDIEAQVVAVGGGKRVFPFDRVEVRLLVTSAEERARFEAIARSGWDLVHEVGERFKALGVRFPEELAIPVEITEMPETPETGATAEPGGRRYALQFRQMSDGAASGSGVAGGIARKPRPVLQLTVMKGQAAAATYESSAERLYLGRLEEVVDASGRVKRRNDVAFLEEGEVNQTVSREHARIAWDAESTAYWLRDEGSASGTQLFRSGRSIEVSRHDRRGVKLEDGDEVYLGRAAVKVGIQNAR